MDHRLSPRANVVHLQGAAPLLLPARGTRVDVPGSMQGQLPAPLPRAAGRLPGALARCDRARVHLGRIGLALLPRHRGSERGQDQ